MAGKRYLLTPGPTPVPPQVLAALAEPVIHHRAREYRDVYERCLARLRNVFARSFNCSLPRVDNMLHLTARI